MIRMDIRLDQGTPKLLEGLACFLALTFAIYYFQLYPFNDAAKATSRQMVNNSVYISKKVSNPIYG